MVAAEDNDKQFAPLEILEAPLPVVSARQTEIRSFGSDGQTLGIRMRRPRVSVETKGNNDGRKKLNHELDDIISLAD
jgi:hypothetical protein